MPVAFSPANLHHNQQLKRLHEEIIMRQQAMRYLFILSLALIAAAYYIGVSTDAATLGTQLNALGKTFTGRNPAGNFAAYPGGATLQTAA
jgi:hypothetical protein